MGAWAILWQRDRPTTHTMVGMADHDDGAETDSTNPILDEHGDVRSRFVELWNLRTSGGAGAVAIDAAWQPIANLLDGHASADAAAAYPTLLKPDSAETPKKTDGAHPAE
jgi:hypothetical protein